MSTDSHSVQVDHRREPRPGGSFSDEADWIVGKDPIIIFD